MKNPWLYLTKSAPFVLPEDAAFVARFNEKHRGEDCELHTELPPEPYAGRHDAPVVLLALNPGYDPADQEYMLENRAFAECMRLAREFGKQEYPFYHLNEGFPENPGRKYWNGILKQPVHDLGAVACAQGFLLLQLYPYKSKCFKKMGLLPSFAFTKELLLQAMQRNAIIIQLRSKKEWEKHVPELTTYPKRFVCRSCLKPVVSPGNIGQREYAQVIAAVRDNL